VLDNGQDEGPPLAECLPDGVATVPMDGNRGYTGGANAALAHWRTHHPDEPFAVVGSHDLHVEPDALSRLVNAAAARPRCGILAPAIVGPKAVSGGLALGSRWIQLPLEGTPEVVERDWANGTCLLLRRTCVDEVGEFDERLGSYGEDVDYGLRARDRGWQVLVLTSAHVHGLGSASARASDDKVLNTVLLTAKRSGARGAGTWVARLAARAVVDGAAGIVAPDRRRSARQNGRVLRRLATDGRLAAVLSGRAS
jgi:GT2 family glycosyltransferase